jgi:hypothetical protein
MLTRIFTLVLVCSAVACGDDSAPGTDAGSARDGGGRDAARADAGGTDAAGIDADLGDAATGDAGDTPLVDAGSDAGDTPLVDAGSDAGDTPRADAGEPGDARVVLTDLVAYSNCMPVIGGPRDPIIVVWTATISGGTGPTATVTAATFAVDGASQDLTVDMPVIPLIGGAGSSEQRRVSGTPALAGACTDLCSASTADLQVVFDIGGESVGGTVSAPYGGCVH